MALMASMSCKFIAFGFYVRFFWLSSNIIFESEMLHNTSSSGRWASVVA